MNADGEGDELRRLEEGPSQKERPGGIGTVTLIGECDSTSQRVAERCRDVLRIVLSETGEHWPTLEQWKARLPVWFLEACAPEMSEEEMHRWLERWRSLPPKEQAEEEARKGWSLEDWLYWLEPSQRPWVFWDCIVRDVRTVLIEVQVDGWPTPLGALRWLLLAAGADRVTDSD